MLNNLLWLIIEDTDLFFIKSNFFSANRHREIVMDWFAEFEAASAMAYWSLAALMSCRQHLILFILVTEVFYFSICYMWATLYLTVSEPDGVIVAVALLVLAACESAFGLCLSIILYKYDHSNDFFDDYNVLSS
jgi:NADH:ubiquinone oxidoreductase subunit K